MIPVAIGYVVVYVTLAYYAGRWNRGVLPVAAALAVLLLIFAAVAGPGWFNRDKAGFAQPTIDSGILGLLTLLDRARADPARRVRDARLPAGLERRARAAGPRRGRRGAAGGPGRLRGTPSPPRLSAGYPRWASAAVAER